MIKARYSDKALVVDILTRSFKGNKSVNYIIKQRGETEGSIRQLMSYAFEVCYRFGRVLLADNKTGCALVMLPDKKRTTPYSIFLDIRLAVTCIGLSNIGKAIRREWRIKSLQPKQDIYYLWFIGIEPHAQGQGTGSQLLQELLTDAKTIRRMVCLETSTLENIPWYKKHGFTIYGQLNFGYELFFLKH